jgi:hypothetical protein
MRIDKIKKGINKIKSGSIYLKSGLKTGQSGSIPSQMHLLKRNFTPNSVSQDPFKINPLAKKGI